MKPALQTTGLLILGAMPILAGAARLSEMSIGAPQMDPTASSTHMPVSLAIHITMASVFLILGVVQFLPAPRRTAWHRRTGRIAVLAGGLGAGSGLILTLSLPIDPSAGPLLVPMRAIFSALWIVALALGVMHARGRNMTAHRAWMIRGYAIGAATGLQSLILLPWFFMFGVPTGLPSDLVMLGGWLLALAVGEYVIRRAPRRTSAVLV